MHPCPPGLRTTSTCKRGSCWPFPPDILQQQCDLGAQFDECDSSQECPPGTIGTPPKCEPEQPEECPKGEELVDGVCEEVEDEDEDDEDEDDEDDEDDD